MVSLLKQERLTRGWSRSYIEAKTDGRITQPSLARWEDGAAYPRSDNIEVLSRLYGKSATELGLDRSSGIMGVEKHHPVASQEGIVMSDIIGRFALSDLGSYLTGLISAWPRRNHRYEELQHGINQAILDHTTLVGQDAISTLNRRQALISLGLVPIQLIGGRPITDARKADADTLLPHCAAGITSCWYLRRGKDLIFVSDLTSSYISILQPLIYSRSEAHRKAAAGLLAQCFGLKSKLADALQYDDQAIAYEEEALRYALMADNVTEQAITNREMALLYWERDKYEQALPYAQTAYGLAKNTPRIIRSFTVSGLSLCQAACGKTEEAQTSLTEAIDLFDTTMPTGPMPYSEAVLTSVGVSVYQRIGNFKESATLSAKILTLPGISALGAIQERIKYATTEVSRDDIQTRNMDLCITLLAESITGVRELDSKLFIRKARECYNLFRIAWPREDAIKRLGKEHFSIQK